MHHMWSNYSLITMTPRQLLRVALRGGSSFSFVAPPYHPSSAARRCPGPWRPASALGSSLWSSSSWPPYWDWPQPRLQAPVTVLSPWRWESWKDWETPCPSGWPSDCGEEGNHTEDSTHFTVPGGSVSRMWVCFFFFFLQLCFVWQG